MKSGRTGVLRAAALLAASATLLAAFAAGPSAPRAAAPRVAELVYSGGRTARCFGTAFVRHLNADTNVAVDEPIDTVSLADAGAMNRYPFVILSGEGHFALAPGERANLRSYLQHGGFVLASAGCSSPYWEGSFRREMNEVIPGHQLQALPMSHPLFNIVYAVPELKTSTGRAERPPVLEGLTIDGRLVMVYSSEGLNDSAHAYNCCCCGGDELINADYILANIYAYALTH